MARLALVSLATSRTLPAFCRLGGDAGAWAGKGKAETRSQNSRRRSTRRSGGLPAMSAALTAPMEMPATQFGVCRAATSASNTPAW